MRAANANAEPNTTRSGLGEQVPVALREGGNGTIPALTIVREAPMVAEEGFRTTGTRHGSENLSGGAACGQEQAAALTLHRAVHQPNSYWAVQDRRFYTATLDESRRDDQDRALYVVKVDGREFTTVRTVPQVREAILSHVAGG